jgi:hypothetical protein
MPSLSVTDQVAPVQNRSSSRNWLGCPNHVLFLYFGFSLAVSVAAYLRPLATYDRYLYAGAVASLRYSDAVTIHRIARTEFDAEPNPYRFDIVADEPYFADVYADPRHFAEQMGLFRAKLGYVALGYVLWRAGLPILVGLRLISAACFLSMALVLLLWTHEAMLSALLLLTPPVLNMGRMVTADPLSTMVITLALFALARGRVLLSVCLLIGSIWARPDHVILVMILLAWVVWDKQCHPLSGAMSAAVALLSAVLVNRIAGLYGWRVLMQHGFIKPEVDPLTHPVAIDLSGYLHALAGLRTIPYTSMTMFALIAVAAWMRMPRNSVFHKLLPVIATSTVARLLIFPNFDDRYFVWAYLFGAIALIRAACSRGSAKCEDAGQESL